MTKVKKSKITYCQNHPDRKQHGQTGMCKVCYERTRRGAAVNTPVRPYRQPLNPVYYKPIHVVETEHKCVEWDLNETGRESIEIIHLTDLQYGHKAFKRDKWETYRDWILSVDNRYVVLGGDIIDAATQLSIGSPFDNTGQPIQQYFEVCELLEPIRERILGYVGGNHERRGMKAFGDIGIIIADKLKIPYSSGQQYVHVYFGEHQPFRIKLHHGIGMARTHGARMNMIQRIADHADADLTLVGHLHDAMVHYFWREKSTGGGIEFLKSGVAMSSSFLGFWNTYAEVAALPMADTMMARCVLYPQKSAWEITLR